MSFISTLAQSSYQVYSTDSSLNSAISESGGLALIAAVYVFAFIIGIAGYVLSSIFLMRIFKKAGVPGWAAWVPIYNNWKTLEIGGQQGFWAVLALIPFVNIVSVVFLYIAMYHIGKSLGKGDAFVVLAIFLPLVWLIWLAVDKSTWNGAPAVVADVPPAPVAPTPPTTPQV